MSEGLDSEVVENRDRIENVSGQNDTTLAGNSENRSSLSFFNNEITLYTDTYINIAGDEYNINDNKVTYLGRNLIIDILTGSTEQINSHSIGEGSVSTNKSEWRDVTTLDSSSTFSFDNHTLTRDGDKLILESSGSVSDISNFNFSEILIDTGAGTTVQYLTF